MKYLASLLLVAAMALAFAPKASAQKWNWTKIGEVSVDTSLDRTSVKCSDKGVFSALKFRVTGAPVDFRRIYVKYANGSVEQLDFRELVRQGQDSGTLDLRGDKRLIREITLYFQAEKRGSGRGREARVQIWGRH